MRKYSKFIVMKLFLLILALFFCIMLFFSEQYNYVQNSFVFVVDVTLSMNAKDINWNTNIWEEDLITRLDITKKYINSFVEKNRNIRVGLVLLSDELDYFLPITADTGIFLLYVDNLYATKESVDFVSNSMLSGVFGKENQNVLVFSDMDFTNESVENKFWKYSNITWFVVGSDSFVTERFSDGVYVDDKKTIANDEIAKKLVNNIGGKYYILDSVDIIEKYLFSTDNFVSFSSERKWWYFVLVLILVFIV